MTPQFKDQGEYGKWKESKVRSNMEKNQSFTKSAELGSINGFKSLSILGMKNKILLIVVGAGMLTLVCVVLYFTSDHHAYNVAVKRYREKEYKAAVAILDRLAPKYQDSAEGTYLRRICLYNLALESYGFKRYDESLEYLAPIPESFVKYEDVKELRIKIDQKKRDAEAKERERRRREEEEVRHKAEEQRLYGADLNVRVNYSDGQIHVANLNSYDWVDVEFKINSGLFSDGYFSKRGLIKAGYEYSVGIMQFANSKGERFNPFLMKPRTFTIVAHKPNGKFDVQSYEWD